MHIRTWDQTGAFCPRMSSYQLFCVPKAFTFIRPLIVLTILLRGFISRVKSPHLTAVDTVAETVGAEPYQHRIAMVGLSAVRPKTAPAISSMSRLLFSLNLVRPAHQHFSSISHHPFSLSLPRWLVVEPVK
ncbi:unnamed protein product [Protopolystoma xenopodis]|uniref:Uncharacterized protein n=1 Tax=Protopolystoma xenopodis TaxID=117903 RepID=A0A3S5BRT8_9PLAT|nr:unnamed protein product [Protopolystoma xenopodis]